MLQVCVWLQEGLNVSDSPTAELEQKDDAYYSEIRNFLSKNIDSMVEPARSPPPRAAATPLKDLSDENEDEKTSELTIVDDVEDEDDDLPLSDDADAEIDGDADIDSAGEELNLVVPRAERSTASPTLNNNGEVKDSDKADAVHEKENPEESASQGSKEGFEVGVPRTPVACSS